MQDFAIELGMFRYIDRDVFSPVGLSVSNTYRSSKLLNLSNYLELADASRSRLMV